MNKVPKEYKIGELVFAKIRGYSAWPAKITGKVGKTYAVYFYGIGQIGYITSKSMFKYEEHKHIYATPKNLKRLRFRKACEAIQFDLDNRNGVTKKTSTAAPKKANTKNAQSKVKSNIAKPKAAPMSPEPNYLENSLYNVLLVHAPRNQVIAINLDYNKPKSFASATEQAEWEAATLKEAEELKFMAEFNLIKIEPVEGRFIYNLPIDEIQETCTSRFIEQVLASEKALYTEKNFVVQTNEFRNALSSRRTDASKALSCLYKLVNLEYSKVMLLRNPDFVDIIRKSRRYAGSPQKWKLGDTDIRTYNAFTTTVRQFSAAIYNIFKDIFQHDHRVEFWSVFIQHVQKFKASTKHLKYFNCAHLNDTTYIKLLEMQAKLPQTVPPTEEEHAVEHEENEDNAAARDANQMKTEIDDHINADNQIEKEETDIKQDKGVDGMKLEEE